MNQADFADMPPKEITQMAKDLNINVKGKNPRDLVPLIIKAMDGLPPDEGDAAPETGVLPPEDLEEALGGDELPEDPTPEQIIAAESNLLDDEDPDAAPVNLDGMTEEEVLMHQIKVAEASKAHPAVLHALYNAYERLTAAPQPAPAQHVGGPEHHPVVHTANQAPTARPPKAGSHWPTADEAIAMLSGHVKRGLIVTKLPKDMLKLKHGGREMAQTLKQPLRTILQQANLLMRPTGKPTEDMSYEEILAEKISQTRRG